MASELWLVQFNKFISFESSLDLIEVTGTSLAPNNIILSLSLVLSLTFVETGTIHEVFCIIKKRDI